MKIVAEHLVNVVKRNGPDKYETIIKVVELENGSLFEERLAQGCYDYKKCGFSLEDLANYECYHKGM